MIILFSTILIMLISLILLLYRCIKGPTFFDRMIACNSLGTVIILLIVLMGQWLKTEFYLDVALIYALVNFITLIAFWRHIEFKVNYKEE